MAGIFSLTESILAQSTNAVDDRAIATADNIYTDNSKTPCNYHAIPVRQHTRLLIATVANTMINAYPRFRYFWSVLEFNRVLLSDVSCDACAHLFWLAMRASSKDDMLRFFSVIQTSAGSRPLMAEDLEAIPSTDDLLNFLAFDYFGLFAATPVAQKARLAVIQTLVFSRVVYTAFTVIFPRNWVSFDQKWRTILLTTTAALFGSDSPSATNEWLIATLTPPPVTNKPQQTARKFSKINHTANADYEAHADALRLGPRAREQLRPSPHMTAVSKLDGPLDFRLSFRPDDLEPDRDILEDALVSAHIAQLQVMKTKTGLVEDSPTPLGLLDSTATVMLELDGRTPLLGRAMKLHHLETSESRQMAVTTMREPRLKNIKTHAQSCLARAAEREAAHVKAKGVIQTELNKHRKELVTELDHIEKEKADLVATKGSRKAGTFIVTQALASRKARQ
ncbi:hypothetical protein J8273_7632 [Carpediemonas membranifera]|uniref:Uncharacterized protein n=1 Tax=Carpediemonas membranifera TaxID=201153 RepID=A0A8J6AY62_9EUKA|nr:hypothetical protein J8273_7632 [Carpediemonas membranifera]|eukprot:KAG9391308.1 hypothetical protein J8273_7632 [Carpediemonas membranifera]